MIAIKTINTFKQQMVHWLSFNMAYDKDPVFLISIGVLGILFVLCIGDKEQIERYK